MPRQFSRLKIPARIFHSVGVRNGLQLCRSTFGRSARRHVRGAGATGRGAVRAGNPGSHGRHPACHRRPAADTQPDRQPDNGHSNQFSVGCDVSHIRGHYVYTYVGDCAPACRYFPYAAWQSDQWWPDAAASEPTCWWVR
jgi:hypothetical protein